MSFVADESGVPIVSFADVLRTNRMRFGYLKCRLVHMKDRSFVLPDVLMAKGRPREFFSPQFFYPNRIAFFGGDGSADFCKFVAVVIGKVDLEIAFFRGGIVKRCSDGSFIYECAFKSVDEAVCFPAGQGIWRRRNNTFELALYHHTDDTGHAGIRKSGEFWSSPWNIQGAKKLSNISYGYFTSLKRIEHEFHLMEIAMSGMGFAHFLRTEAPASAEFATAIPVPLQTARDRNRTLRFWVDTEIISPSHVWMHRPMVCDAYYEVVLPKVFRIGVKPGRTLPFLGTRLAVPPQSVKFLSYVIVGDADREDGLIAPFNEEETLHLAKIDVIPDDMEIIERWYRQQNTMMFEGIDVELAMAIEDRS